ncbi:inositol-pentakisphosphate 2-kinase [Limtongia smithiae]|uniref:inositol-pentakisphosphate 2-kinase n=1 Tax=Limtongia smithiae TaxID=1125753 RepID=UPI0034CEC27E
MDEAVQITDASELHYVAEGAANVVYEVIDDIDWNGYLLRVRKKVAAQPSTLTVYSFLRETIEPLFEDQIVATQLVRIDPAVLESLNTDLAALEAAGQRHPKRLGTIVDTSEPYALLVQDMRPVSMLRTEAGDIVEQWTRASNTTSLGFIRQLHSNGCLETAVLEFKPKWLVQSHDAPEGWIYCRTCALRHMRAAQRGIEFGAEEGAFCPLDLVSHDHVRIERALQALWPERKGGEGDRVLTKAVLVKAITKFVECFRVFDRLAQVQRDMDTRGVLAVTDEDDDNNLAIAMAVRDCSAFMRVVYGDPVDEEDGDELLMVDGRDLLVTCRFADMDVKDSSGTKRVYWAGIERALREGGWYTRIYGDAARCG